jgi:uncharacterized membrane protein
MTVRVRRHLTAGLLVLVPLVLTVWVVKSVFGLIDGWTRPLMTRLVGYDIPGVGLLATVLFVYLVGLFSTNFFVKKILELFGRVLENLPLVKTVYTASKQLVEAVSPDGRRSFRRVVLVEFPKKGTFTLGFVTGSGVGPLDSRMASVYVPTAINPTSGFVIFVPEDEVVDPGMSVEEAIKLVVSGGVVRSPAAGAAVGSA